MLISIEDITHKLQKEGAINEAKTLLSLLGFKELTTKRQRANGTSIWITPDGKEVGEYETGYIHRLIPTQNVKNNYPLPRANYTI